ncbi:hypothetical protein [Streptomyces dysideae]|uniref:hypothetical protein n=1 Tax=Streptomyces dysideae TaxID=909626 RepID=UPI000AC78BF6|nr:hypothetical protein [Streptomyces dysideae]
MEVTTWPGAILVLGVLLMATTLIGGSMSVYLEIRKAKLQAMEREELRQLVQRYENSPRTPSTHSSEPPPTWPNCGRGPSP